MHGSRGMSSPDVMGCGRQDGHNAANSHHTPSQHAELPHTTVTQHCDMTRLMEALTLGARLAQSSAGAFYRAFPIAPQIAGHYSPDGQVVLTHQVLHEPAATTNATTKVTIKATTKVSLIQVMT